MALSKEYPSLDLLYTETRDRVIRQGTTIEHVNTKTSIVIGTDAVLLVAILGIIANVGSLAEDATVWQSWLIPCLASTCGLLTLASLICSAVAFRPVTYREVLDPRGAHDRLICLAEDESKLKLLHGMIDSFEKTQKRIDRNLQWFRVSLWALALALVVATVTVGLYMFGTM